MSKAKKKPAYSLHRPTGQARVRIDGRDLYLGQWGTAESRRAYDRLIEEWLLKQDATQLRLTIDELALLYVAHVNEYYSRDGKPGHEANCIRSALKRLIAHSGKI